MQWLTQIEHGIVGCVHDVVDGTNARQAQTTLDFIWAGFDFHIADQSKHEARVEFRVSDLDGNQVFNRFAIGFVFDIWLLQLAARQRGEFSRNADHIRITTHIRQDADIQDCVAHVV